MHDDEDRQRDRPLGAAIDQAIDEAENESFPASDPQSSWAGADTASPAAPVAGPGTDGSTGSGATPPRHRREKTRMNGYVLSVERTIPVAPDAVFDVVADAGQHTLYDGSGMLQGALAGPSQRLALGMTFGMRMKLGVRYSTVNKVVEFEENRKVAWQTGPEGIWGRLVGGRIWRYELEPVEGGTRVRESWDITSDHQRPLLKLGGIYSGKTRRDMERTLVRLDQLLTSDEAPIG
jgi:uncharacterized protein YndB with AHSA1/START domain